jgi:Ca2+-transporting ATPase
MSAAQDAATVAGLTQQEATARLTIDGANELPQLRRRTVFRIVLEVFREPMFQLLLAAGFIYLAIGDLREALMLLGFAFVNILIATYQESKTERALEALRVLASPKAVVIRDGIRRRIASRELVRDDIIVISEGDRVPADALVVSGTGIEADESLLTGEAIPVRKHVWRGGEIDARPGGDDRPFIYSGTLIVKGHGTGKVRFTGAGTEIGKIGSALSGIQVEPTLLHVQVRKLVRAIAFVALILSVTIFGLYVALRGAWLQGLLAGITLAMSLLPQELPLVLTVFLVMGSRRIAKKGVLTRRSTAIEALGAATVLCTDKTGTLTMNRMTAAALCVDRNIYDVDYERDRELPEAFDELVEYAILASQRAPFDPMEKAFLELGQHYLSRTGHLHEEWRLVHEYSLEPRLMAMSHVWRTPVRDEFVIATKGAPEVVADLCQVDTIRKADLLVSAEQMAARGLRVLAVAKAVFWGQNWPATQRDFAFEFVGLIGLTDPLRSGVRDAIAQAASAGIRVVMITGDHPVTAQTIAKQAGLPGDGAVITGRELASFTEDELLERLKSARIFARIMPEQKLRLVEALKRNGEVVAMTGDGVNDAPALKAAQIGIAMGKRGTDVAREAATLVLLDDDFNSIVSAVRLGRRIYDNIRKATSYILSVHVPIAGLSILPLAFGWPVIFTPIHIVFLEMIIDPVSSIVFESEPSEEGSMVRPPRRPDSLLVSRPLIAEALLQGGCMLLVVSLIYAIALQLNTPVAEARALAFVTLVITNFALIFTNRTSAFAFTDLMRRPNSMLWAVLALTSIFLAGTLVIPTIRALFFFDPLHRTDLILCLAAGMGSLLILELVKWIVRRTGLRTDS